MAIVTLCKHTRDIGAARFGYQHDQVWNDDVLYLERRILWFGFSLRLHTFHHADDVSRGIHNHPWWFITWVLPKWLGNTFSCYIENRSFENPSAITGPGAYVISGLHYSPPDRAHAITAVAPGTRTLVFTGLLRRRDWGFFDRDGNFTPAKS